MVDNFSLHITNDHLIHILSLVGDFHDLLVMRNHNQNNASIRATYYDVRHASAAVSWFNNQLIARRLTKANFCHQFEQQQLLSPFSGMDQRLPMSGENWGIIVVSEMPYFKAPSICALAHRFGNVKQIYRTKSALHEVVIEYFDVRDSQMAINELNTKTIDGKRLQLRFQPPCGFFGNFDLVLLYQSSEMDAFAQHGIVSL